MAVALTLSVPEAVNALLHAQPVKAVIDGARREVYAIRASMGSVVAVYYDGEKERAAPVPPNEKIFYVEVG